MIRAEVDRGELLNRRVIRVAVPKRINEKLEQLLHQKARSSSSAADDFYDVFSTEVCCLPVDRLGGVVVLIRLNKEAVFVPLVMFLLELPTGKRTGDLLHIALAIVRIAGHDVVSTHREQLLELSSEVFVRDSQLV